MKKRPNVTVSVKHKNGNLPANATREGSRWLTSLFILFHIIAILTWTIPGEIPLVRDVKETLRPYMVWTGLFQSWDTFAPNPRAENYDVKAMVITEARHPRVWAFPQMQELSFRQRYSKERYRKFSETIAQPQFAPTWPDIARHIADICGDPSDVEEKVLLIYSSQMIANDSALRVKRHTRIFFDDYVTVAGRGN